MRIPLVDLRAQRQAHRAALDAAVNGVLDGANFVKGPEVAAFEEAFASYCEARHAIGVGNGTDALELAMAALGLERGGEVLTAPNSFVATAEAIERAGGRVRFADVDASTWLLEAPGVDAATGRETVGLVPVHLFGHAVPMEAIGKLAEARGLWVVEDTAQAHGARSGGRPVGALRDAGAFSFYPGKNLGAYGDGGAVVTNDYELAERVRRLADHGRHDKYEHLEVGRNSRLDTLQAAVLLVKLRFLDEANARRRALAARYREQLASTPGVRFPAQPEGSEPVHHLLVIALENRDGLRTFLAERGIASGIHYPIPLHLQPALRHLGYARGDFPVAERLADEILSLPLYPELTDGAVDEIAAATREFVGTG